MPHHEHPSAAGDLVAFANIIFPSTLDAEQRAVIDSIFPK
jgi:hypothetical protein